MPKSKETINRRFFCLLDFGDRLSRGLTSGKSLTGGLIYKSANTRLRSGRMLSGSSRVLNGKVLSGFSRVLSGRMFSGRVLSDSVLSIVRMSLMGPSAVKIS